MPWTDSAMSAWKGLSSLSHTVLPRDSSTRTMPLAASSAKLIFGMPGVALMMNCTMSRESLIAPSMV